MNKQTDHARCVQLLGNMGLFQEAKASELEALARSVRLVYLERRAILFQRGDPCDGFHVVVYGRVKLSLLSAQGLDKPLQFIEQGGSLGDITMFLERPYYLNAQALDDCLLLHVPRQGILNLIEHDSRFALRMLASLSMRMRHVVDDIESFSLQPPAARLITYLLRMLPPGAMSSARIDLSINKNMVAAQLNLAPETLSRLFRDFVSRGLLTIEGRTVLVHDVDQLGEFLNEQNKVRP